VYSIPLRFAFFNDFAAATALEAALLPEQRMANSSLDKTSSATTFITAGNRAALSMGDGMPRQGGYCLVDRGVSQDLVYSAALPATSAHKRPGAQFCARHRKNMENGPMNLVFGRRRLSIERMVRFKTNEGFAVTRRLWYTTAKSIPTKR